jgi:hypothetical protein
MREIFIEGLYKVSVSQARMQMVVEGLDPVSTLPSEIFIVQVRFQVMPLLHFLVEEFNIKIVHVLHWFHHFCPCNIKYV